MGTILQVLRHAQPQDRFQQQRRDLHRLHRDELQPAATVRSRLLGLDHTLAPRREELAAKHRDWQLGLVWTLQNHPRVPEDVREKYSGWGLPKDEFTDNGHWPYNLYVREGRRMVSDFVMTEHQCRQDPGYPQVTDSVGMGAYTMDSHHVQRVIWKGN